MSGHALKWEGVRAGYGERDVLHDVSLTVEPGGSVALLGPNGAGKTTLARMTMGLVRARAGRVLVGDWDTAHRRPDQLAARVGYAFQHADQQLFARSVWDDVAFGPRRLGSGDAHVTQVLRELGLDGAAGRHPHDLPAPRRKLVALAGVLAMRTGVLVLDEPTAGFDRASRDLVAAALRRRLELGTTVVVISHDLAFIAEVAERVVVLSDGRVVSDLRARSLLRDPVALAALGLRPPPAAAVALDLGLPGEPVRVSEVAAGLAGRHWLPAR